MTAATTSHVNDLKRTIYFYRAVTVRDAAGSPSQFPASDILKHLNSLPHDKDGRYMEDNDREVTCVIDDDSHVAPRMRLAYVRRRHWPQVEAVGAISNLPLTDPQGLLDSSHLLFLPNNIVGVEFDSSAPRIGALSRYVKAKAGDLTRGRFFGFEALLRHDAETRLAAMKSLTSFELRVTQSFASELAQLDADSPAASINAAAKFGEVHTVEIALRAQRRKTLAPGVLKFVRKIFASDSAQAEKFKIAGLNEDGEPSAVDFLSERLLSRKTVARLNANSKAVESASAYAAIRRAYDEMRSEIDLASSIS